MSGNKEHQLSAMNVIHHVIAHGHTPKYKEVKKATTYFFDELDRESQIWNKLVRFHFRHNYRDMYQRGYKKYYELMTRMDGQDEREVEVRISAMRLGPGEEWWTKYGLLTDMAILKPKHEGQCGDLRYWTLLMIFGDHQKKVIKLPAASAIGEFDHIMAMYAMLRRWPIYFPAWVWVIGYDYELHNDVPEYGHSLRYKHWWKMVEEQAGSQYPLKDNVVEWDLEKHTCYWEKFCKDYNASIQLPRL